LFYVPPPQLEEGHKVTACPAPKEPLRLIFLSLPSAKNPTDWLSGDQNESDPLSAAQVRNDGLAGKESSSDGDLSGRVFAHYRILDKLGMEAWAWSIAPKIQSSAVRLR
jgi:hypothetical protein